MFENLTDTKQQNPARARGVDRLIAVLSFIYDADKPLKPAEIAKGLGAPRSTISGVQIDQANSFNSPIFLQ